MYVLAMRSMLEPSLRTLYFAGMACFVVGTLCVVGFRLLAKRTSIERILFITLPFDLVGLALLAVSAFPFEDPFYAFYIGAGALYAAVFRRSSAWIYAGLLTISYLAAHLTGMHTTLGLPAYVFVVMKATTILLVGFAVSRLMEQQVERQAFLEEQSLHVAELNLQLERSVAEMQAIAEISEIIHSTLDFDSVGPLMIDILQKVLNIPAACIFVIDKAKQQTLFSASKGLRSEGTYSYTGPGVIAEASLADDEHFACMELLDHNEMLVVFCADTRHIDGLDDDDRMVLSAVSSELVVAVENSRLYKLTKRLSVTDELTDLYNYRFLQQRLDDEIGRARRYSKTLSFLMLDVDSFKAINDTHGHLIGDAVLADMGHVLKANVREVDVVARYGGEEFSVLLPETDAAGAFIVAEKIREAVALHRFTDEDGERTVRVTVSIGLANFPAHADDKESLLKAADDAVYQAKTLGRDRVRAPRIRMTRLGRPTAPDRTTEETP
ncbi:MAG: diguanylate [Actinobacteria bacterium]|nr:MAG: diguanylate [Actinomycetota bacterium]